MLAKIMNPLILTTVACIVGGSIAFVGTPLFLFESIAAKVAWLFFSPFILTLLMVLIGGSLSYPFHAAIISGIFPRDPSSKLYFGRKIYGTCLSTIMYFPATYYLILNISFFKKLFFRLFGYEGQHLSFTAYTDTWIRDVRLLTLGERSYLANQSTIGTNICLTDGNIMVGRIKIGDDTQVGRLCILGPGSRMGNNCETGVRTVLGIRTVIKDKVKLAGGASLSHGVLLHEGVDVQEYSYLGTKCEVYAGIKLPAGSYLEAGTILTNQEEADNFHQTQNQQLRHSLSERFNRVSMINAADHQQ